MVVRLRESWLITALVCAAGVLVAFDDIAPLQQLAGTFGASLAWAPLLLCGLLLPRDRLSIWPRALIVLAGLGFATTAVTLVLLPPEARGTNLYGKAFAVGIPVMVFFCIMVVAARLAAYRPSLVTMFGLVSLGVLLLFGMLDMVGALPRTGVWFLHGLDNLNQRARGGRFEASALGGGVLVALGTATLRVRKKAWALGICAAAGVLAFLMPSRGTLAAGAVFCAAILCAVVLHRFIPRVGRWANHTIGSILVIITLVGGFALGWLVTAPQWGGMSYSTSDAVRSVWGDVGLDVAIHNPAGMGYSAPIAWLPAYVQDAMDRYDGRFSASDFTELTDQINSGHDYGFSPKTMPSLVGVYLGAVGVLALIAMWLAIGRKAAEAWRSGYFMVAPAAIAVAIVSSAYFSSIYAWEQAFLLGALLGTRQLYWNEAPTQLLTPIAARWSPGPAPARPSGMLGSERS
ncbi:hypothetical protein ACIBF5_27050 [Micromonospora sp. NPDC050417]|uniref:hypothetical protein n=1 Tax=Micromonospora sp. NPDC050417 TaxID=3364280 RepID=UPI0037B4AC0E